MAEASGAQDPEAGADRATSGSLREVVRLAGTDLNGEKQVVEALCGIRGVGRNVAHAIVNALDISPAATLGSLDEETQEAIEACIDDPSSQNIPPWLFNRQRDPETGENKHLTGGDLELAHEFDIRKLKESGTYRGWRHSKGLPVRGQRTRTSFRGKTAIGVKRKRVKEEAEEGEGE